MKRREHLSVEARAEANAFAEGLGRELLRVAAKRTMPGRVLAAFCAAGRIADLVNPLLDRIEKLEEQASRTVELRVGIVEGDRRVPLIIPSAEATADDRQRLDRWRVLVHELNGYTAITTPGGDKNGAAA